MLGATTLQMLDVLYAHNWRNIKDDSQAQILAFGEDSFIGTWLEEKIRRSKEQNESRDLKHTRNGKGKRRKHRGGGGGNGRDPSKGTGSRDPRQGPSPEQIQKWFGDVPW